MKKIINQIQYTVTILVIAYLVGLYYYAEKGAKYIGQTRVHSAIPEPVEIIPPPSLQWRIITWMPVIFFLIAIIFLLAIAYRIYVQNVLRYKALKDPRAAIASAYSIGKTPSNRVLDFYRTPESMFPAKAHHEHRKSLEPFDLEDPSIYAPKISLHEAISQSQPTSWIMGQIAPDQPNAKAKSVPANPNRFVTFDYRRSGHMAILGGTGSGKTESSGMLAVYYARKFGLHVILLDGKDGLDWRPHSHGLEWHEMTPYTVATQIEAIHSIYLKRVQMCLKKNVNSIYAIKPTPQPLFIVLEEFGDTWAELKRIDKKRHAAAAGMMDTLLRKARAMGIILCFIDQAPENWSKQMKGNTKFAICYKLNGGQGNAFSEYFVDQLQDFGIFSRDNTFYIPWHTSKEINMRTLRRNERRYIADSKPVPQVMPEKQQQPRLQQPGPQAAHKPNPPKHSTPQPLIRAYQKQKRTSDWAPFVKKYMQIYRDCTAADIAKEMARLVDDGREWRNFYSLAHGLHKKQLQS